MKMNWEKEFSTVKNGILNPLGILFTPQNIWPQENPCWLDCI